MRLREFSWIGCVCVWLLACSFSCSAQSAELIVISRLNASNTAESSWEWVVSKRRFADPKNLWNPDSEIFPVDINQYCLIARTNVMARNVWSSVPELALVHIRQIYAQVNPNDASSPPVRRTALSFHFREAGAGPALGPVQPVIMLLDGTVAELRKQSAKGTPK